MSGDSKILLGIAGLTVIVIGIVVVGSSASGKPADPVVINRGINVRGPESAPVTLVEFSDFQCPACKSFEPVVEEVINKYSDRLRFIYRHYPLPQHDLAFKAAQASQAADLQGKFWEYKKEVFAIQENLKEGSFEEIAQKLGLDLEKFRNDLNDEKTAKKVQQDLSDAKALNLNGTPSFFVNGEKIELDSYQDLLTAVEAKLK